MDNSSNIRLLYCRITFYEVFEIKKRLSFNTITMLSCAVIAVLFLSVLVYIGVFEGNAVFGSRNFSSYFAVQDYTCDVIRDEAAPAGVYKQYSWTLGPEIGDGNDTLAFYLVHTYAEVRINGELVYSLYPDPDNTVGHSTSSNWALIPLKPSDMGKEVVVTIIPAYTEVIHRNVQFMIGSRFQLIWDCIKHDIPQLVLSSLCIFIGLLVTLTQLIINIRRKHTTFDMLFLGVFTFLIGLWRITDMRISPLLFPSNTMALGYIAIGTLFILPIPLLLFIKSRFSGSAENVMLAFVFATCLSSLAVMLCQLTGIAEFKQTLIVAHIMMIADILAILFVSVIYRRQVCKKLYWLLVISLALGALSDLIWYYLNDSSSGILFTVCAILIYVIVQFFDYLATVNKKMLTDANTGLLNKRRWDALMEENRSIARPTCIIMYDLNNLKSVNDSIGHNAGDRIIADFASILRKAMPQSAYICRWGGDEFTVLFTDTTKAEITSVIASVKAKVNAYNDAGAQPGIHFAVGYALSADFPGLSLQELFEKADKNMYRDKQLWYKENGIK